jgi:hypothetical protein
MKWKVSIMELKNGKVQFKVTRTIPEMKVSETKLFDKKEDALRQLSEWTA